RQVACKRLHANTSACVREPLWAPMALLARKICAASLPPRARAADVDGELEGGFGPVALHRFTHIVAGTREIGVGEPGADFGEHEEARDWVGSERGAALEGNEDVAELDIDIVEAGGFEVVGERLDRGAAREGDLERLGELDVVELERVLAQEIGDLGER